LLKFPTRIESNYGIRRYPIAPEFPGTLQITDASEAHAERRPHLANGRYTLQWMRQDSNLRQLNWIDLPPTGVSAGDSGIRWEGAIPRSVSRLFRPVRTCRNNIEQQPRHGTDDQCGEQDHDNLLAPDHHEPGPRDGITISECRVAKQRQGRGNGKDAENAPEAQSPQAMEQAFQQQCDVKYQ
jgi:hypothetical protein